MYYTKEEVMEYVSQEDIKFIRLAYCDIFGKPKNIAVMPSELSRAFETGIPFDASAVHGFGREEASDLFLFPDPKTLSMLLWRPSHGKVVRMLCNVMSPDGRQFPYDSRYMLTKAIADARDMGIMCYFGAEFEFYLFKTDENGLPTKTPFDNAGYTDIAPEDSGENVRREICLTLEEMGIQPERSHHEEGPGQNEIDFRYSDALSAADNAITFKTVVKTIAARNGLSASFEPKPLHSECGNGMHINLSPQSLAGRDIFMPFMAGVLAHVKEMTLFLNPTANSYERLGGYKAPKYITWSPQNRSQLIRLPAADKVRSRIELRSPDATANPYLAFALIIWAGLDGVRNGMVPPPSTDLNLYKAPVELLKTFQKLPENLAEAKAAARDSIFIGNVLPEAVLEEYCARTD
ncbi:MAG: glutamine synthetase family protein [Oscillospiraceae bacterium]